MSTSLAIWLENKTIPEGATGVVYLPGLLAEPALLGLVAELVQATVLPSHKYP